MSSSAASSVMDVSRFNTEAFEKISTTKAMPNYLRVMTKTNNFNPSLVIPNAPKEITMPQVKKWIERRDRLGVVELIQFKYNQERGNKAIYVHFVRWTDEDKREEVNEGRFIKLYDEEECRYWKMIKSDMGKPLPLISHEPAISWVPRKEEEDFLPDDACDREGDIPDPEDRKMSLVIPLVLKGYTTEHVKYVFEKSLLFDTITRVDPVKLKASHRFANTHLTFYVHGVFKNTYYANYIQRYIMEKVGNTLDGDKMPMQFKILHRVDAQPRNHHHTNWSWVVKMSDLKMPDTKREIKKVPTVPKTRKRVEDPNVKTYKSVLFRPSKVGSTASGSA